MIEQLLKKVDLSRFPFTIKLWTRRAPYDGHEILVVEMYVNDRDLPGVPNRVTMEFSAWAGFLSEKNEICMLRWILQCVTELVVHEVQECFLYDGVRIFDPHAGEKKT